MINQQSVNRVDKVKDLSIIFDCYLSFRDHLSYAMSKALRCTGFVTRFTCDIHNVNVILYLFKSLVLLILSYGSVIWSTPLKQDERLLETPQRRLIRYLSFKIKQPMHRFDHDFSALSKLFGINTVKSLHTY